MLNTENVDDNDNLIEISVTLSWRASRNLGRGHSNNGHRLEHKLLFILTTNPRSLHDTSHISIDNW